MNQIEKTDKEDSLKRIMRDLDYALGRFNWGSSALDAQAIDILNTWKIRLDKVAITKDILLEKIENLDLELAIATDVIENKTGKKVELPEGVEDLFDIYRVYVFSRLKKELLKSEDKND